jgi:hypothetical protein
MPSAFVIDPMPALDIQFLKLGLLDAKPIFAQ